MVKNCPNCGKEFPDNINFCAGCGVQLVVKQVAPIVTQPQTVQPPIQSPVVQYPKKSKIGLLVGLLVMVAVIIIVIVLLFFFVFQSDAGQLVGAWDEEYQVGVSSSSAIWTFYDDGRVKIANDEYSSAIWRDYEVKGGMVCLSSDEYSYYHCYDYEFSEGGNKLTLSAADVNSIVLNKI